MVNKKIKKNLKFMMLKNIIFASIYKKNRQNKCYSYIYNLNTFVNLFLVKIIFL